MHHDAEVVAVLGELARRRPAGLRRPGHPHHIPVSEHVEVMLPGRGTAERRDGGQSDESGSQEKGGSEEKTDVEPGAEGRVRRVFDLVEERLDARTVGQPLCRLAGGDARDDERPDGRRDVQLDQAVGEIDGQLPVDNGAQHGDARHRTELAAGVGGGSGHARAAGGDHGKGGGGDGDEGGAEAGTGEGQRPADVAQARCRGQAKIGQEEADAAEETAATMGRRGPTRATQRPVSVEAAIMVIVSGRNTSATR